MQRPVTEFIATEQDHKDPVRCRYPAEIPAPFFHLVITVLANHGAAIVTSIVVYPFMGARLSTTQKAESDEVVSLAFIV